MTLQALPVTLRQTAAIRPAPLPHLKTAAVTVRTVPAHLHPHLHQLLSQIPQVVLTKAPPKKERRRNEQQIHLI